jgi:uncharacterized protein (DUF1330 family)
MTEARIISILANQCPLKDEAKLNKWYNEVHIPMLFKYKGIKKMTRYQLIGESKELTKYLAIYEFEDKKALEGLFKSPEWKAAAEEWKETWKDENIIKWVTNYEQIETWEK